MICDQLQLLLAVVVVAHCNVTLSLGFLEAAIAFKLCNTCSYSIVVEWLTQRRLLVTSHLPFGMKDHWM